MQSANKYKFTHFLWHIAIKKKAYYYVLDSYRLQSMTPDVIAIHTCYASGKINYKIVYWPLAGCKSKNPVTYNKSFLSKEGLNIANFAFAIHTRAKSITQFLKRLWMGKTRVHDTLHFFELPLILYFIPSRCRSKKGRNKHLLSGLQPRSFVHCTALHCTIQRFLVRAVWYR